MSGRISWLTSLAPNSRWHRGMVGRQIVLGSAFAGALALGSCGLRQATSESDLAVVEIAFAGSSTAALFDPPPAGKDKRWVKVRYRDVDHREGAGKVALRGFSAWHHGRSKPSLRLKPKGKRRRGPASVELSRPEDPLAICNWLPDHIGAGLGLMHEHSEPVRLLLNGRDCGVYLRSIRPGDDLCDAAGRPRSAFFKGDSLGDRRHLDLWASSASWRTFGTWQPSATEALEELLAALREPPTAGSLRRLAGAIDLEQAARLMAVASLVGSIHADAVHNHVMYYNPETGRIEPLLWDANGFGIHAEPELAVNVARHPLAARLLSSPRFLHRRNEVLWEQMRGPASAEKLIAAVDQRLAEIDAALQTDPEIARLVLRRGVFELDEVGYAGLQGARREFLDFVERREAYLERWFQRARVSMVPLAKDPSHTLVTVFGDVAVKLSRTDGAEVLSADGRDAALLWPGIREALVDDRQHQESDGRGVSAPHGVPAALQYVVACPVAQLNLRNAFTGQAVSAEPSPEASKSRSVHPWSESAITPSSPR